jgi:hypothetical protein
VKNWFQSLLFQMCSQLVPLHRGVQGLRAHHRGRAERRGAGGGFKPERVIDRLTECEKRREGEGKKPEE